MIVADTGAVLALIDADDRHHDALSALFDEDPGAWVLPWAILPEVDYLLMTHVDSSAQRAFLNDIAGGAFAIEWGEPRDLERARDLCAKYSALNLGLVDAAVMAVAERLSAKAIATLDVRDFGAVKIAGSPKLLPRDT
jgi:predicted nucleic acid-binding protein